MEKRQQGMTLIGMLLTMAVVVMIAIVVMRMVPVYIQHFAILESIEALNTIPASSLTGDAMMDSTYLRNSLSKRLDINGIDDLKPNELTIIPNGPYKYKLKLKYQVIRPLVYNVSLLFDFNNIIEVKAGSEH